MKKIIVLIIAAFLISVAIAQSINTAAVEARKPVVCDDSKKIYEELINSEYSEKPVWGGVADNTKFVLLINKDTGTWTLIEFNKSTSCILGFGEGSMILDLEKKKLHL